MMTNLNTSEMKCLALIVLSIEYAELYYIPDFSIRIDTAKRKAKELILNKCCCEKCTTTANFVTELNYTDYE